MNPMRERATEACARARERLDAWIDEEVSAAERETLAAHFVACRACDERRSRSEAMRRALRTPTPSAPADLPVRVVARIGGRGPSAMAWQESLPALRRLAAAAAVLFVAAAGFAFLSPATPSAPGDPVAAAATWSGTSDEPSLNHERELLLAVVLPEVLR